ncbi:hypothetical protein [Priestia aryabhattai]
MDTKINIEEMTVDLRKLGFQVEEGKKPDEILITKTYTKGKVCCELNSNKSFTEYLINNNNTKSFYCYGLYGKNNTPKEIVHSLEDDFRGRSRFL